MSITYDAVIDELFSNVKSVIDASGALIGYVPEVRWQGVAIGNKPGMDKFWLRVSQQIVTESQSSLANDQSKKMFETIGLLYVQLFCPRNVAASIDKGRQLAVVIKDAFRQQSVSNEIWYRNQKVVELPETAESYPINVVVEFYFKTLQPAT